MNEPIMMNYVNPYYKALMFICIACLFEGAYASENIGSDNERHQSHFILTAAKSVKIRPERPKRQQASTMQKIQN